MAASHRRRSSLLGIAAPVGTAIFPAAGPVRVDQARVATALMELPV
ncbi:MAG: hypothetical protein LLG14_05955 [Nocardiaceae bacterium]|nr:hypothetical protein [Nocardiaceae bacterium]